MLVALLAVTSQPTAASAASAASAESDARPVVYLTFDDGPSQYTTSYVQLLDRYGAKGTFFMLGQGMENDLRREDPIVYQVLASGHGIANHTWNHPSLAASSNQSIINQLVSTRNLVAQITGRANTCYRPPYGATSQRVVNLAASVGLTNSGWTARYPSGHAGGWDIDTNDFRRSSDRVAYELNKINGGEVVLMHDLHATSYTPLAAWLEANHHRFRFEVLPGCGREIPTPDMSEPEAFYEFQIARLYLSYFERSPDLEGWRYWNTRYVDQLSLQQISDYFATSPEFMLRYGQLRDAAFIDVVYENVLGRAPDSEGQAFWLGQLADGMSRGRLLTMFSESAENVEAVGSRIAGSCWSGEVLASYRCALTLTPGAG